MVGRTNITGSSPSRLLRRDPPQQHPEVSNQWCTKVEEIEAGADPDGDGGGGPGRDEITGWPTYRWSRWRITFEGMPHKTLTDAEADEASAESGEAPELSRYCVRQRKTFVKEQQVPGGAFLTIDDLVPGNRQRLQQTGFKIVLFADVSYTLVRFPVDVLPLTALSALGGKINSTRWDVGEGGYAFDSGTLLAVGWDDDDKYFDANGDWVCDLVLRFRWKQIGWNFFMNNRWQPVEVSLDGTSTGQRPYESTDGDNFNPLFKCEP
jgi:hypothetical protein